jgi:hypothetical protein
MSYEAKRLFIEVGGISIFAARDPSSAAARKADSRPPAKQKWGKTKRKRFASENRVF